MAPIKSSSREIGDVWLYGFPMILTFIAIIWGGTHALPSPCDGVGDCVKYAEMSQAFASGKYGAVEHPFNIRVLAPWLVSLIRDDLTVGFLILNACSATVFAFAVFGICRRLSLGPLILSIILIWFFVHPIGFRLYQVIPVSVDPLAYGLFAATSYFFVAKQRSMMLLTLAVGLLAKESFVFVAVLILISEVLFLFANRIQRSESIILLTPGIILVLFFYYFARDHIVTQLFPQTQTWEITTLSVFKWWIGEIWNDPWRIIVWIGSFFCATGVLSALIWAGGRLDLTPERIRLLAYFGLGACGFVALGLIAGSDMSRIIFNGNIFILIFFMLIAKYKNLSPHILLALLTFSLCIALTYTRHFPTAFEYEYYKDRKINKTLQFVSVVGSTAFLLGLMLRCKRRNGEYFFCRNDGKEVGPTSTKNPDT